MGPQHAIAVGGQPLSHFEDRRPDTQPVHVEDPRRVPGDLRRCEHVRRALAIVCANRNLLVTHLAPFDLGYHDHAARLTVPPPRSLLTRGRLDQPNTSRRTAEAGGTELKNMGDGLMVVFASASGRPGVWRGHAAGRGTGEP